MPDTMQNPEIEKPVAAAEPSGTETTKYRDIQRAPRYGAKDYSHFSITYGVTLKTDSAQRFLENYFPRCDYNLKYLNYSLLWFREDDTGKNFCQEIENALTEYQETMQELTQKMYDMIQTNTDSLSVLGTPTYDNPRSYKHNITNSQSAQLLNCVVAMDQFFQALDLAYTKQLVQMFERQELMQYHVQRLRQIVRQIRTIRNDVMAKSREMANERAERLQKEAEEREKQRQKGDEAREAGVKNPNTQARKRKAAKKATQPQTVEAPTEQPTVETPTDPEPVKPTTEVDTPTPGDRKEDEKM